jgi:Protein of unknown function (DUF2796)
VRRCRSGAGPALLGALAATAVAAGEHEARGAHARGRATLDIAVGGTRVTMALSAPATDILGLGRPVATAEEGAAVAAAKAALADPLALFVPPRAARCRLAEAAAWFEAVIEGESGAGFRAAYALDCAAPGALDWVIFRYFERFPDAGVLEVTLATGRGRAAFRVGRAVPRVVFEDLT